MRALYRPGNTDAERCLCQECQKKKGLKVVDRLIYQIGEAEPVGYFDERGMYQSYEDYEHDPFGLKRIAREQYLEGEPAPHYEELLIPYPEQ